MKKFNEKVKYVDRIYIYLSTLMKLFRGEIQKIFLKKAKGMLFIGSNVKISHKYNIIVGKNTKFERNSEIQGLAINNIKFDTMPSVGEPKLYFKSINNFAKSNIIEENVINDNFDFTITSDDNADLNNPVLYNNLANPITLSYVNQNIKSDYTITDTSTPITYDGSLLSKCNVDLNSISAKISFDINIVNNLDEKFKTTVFINIPLQDDAQSITNGSLTLKQDVNYTFYRY